LLEFCSCKNYSLKKQLPRKRYCEISFLALLTPEGERVFEETFPAHITHLKQRFATLDRQELEQIRVALEKIKNLF
jgi:DNA-binding MarR family transcriptional regulator